MTDTQIGLAGLAALFVLFILRMPVGLSMLTVGFLGTAAISGFSRALPRLSTETFAIASFYQLVIIPMFVLMGNLAGASGMGRDLYNAAYAWVGHVRGGLASATIIACACFASLCGSAAASAVTMGRVALPEMTRFKYDDALATGTVASGGTLGFIFPPSAGLVIYSILTEQPLAKLFMAGVVPGIVLTLLFLLTVGLVTRSARSPDPQGQPPTCARGSMPCARLPRSSASSSAPSPACTWACSRRSRPRASAHFLPAPSASRAAA
jgi:tripartite ATP-independent transporter DctM subunit